LILTERKIKDYQTLKYFWKKSPNMVNEEYKRIIDQDINRLDRNLECYKEDESVYLTMAKDILITYSIFHPEVGYCQGMSDLLSPILETIKDESISFWCFVNYMERMKNNFIMDSKSIENQLNQLMFILETINPDLSKFFKNIESLYLCYRWILVSFKREFKHEDVKRIWEVQWTDYLTVDYHIFMLYGLLSQFQNEIMSENLESYEILSLFNRNSLNFDLKKFLQDSMTAYYMYEDQFDFLI
jgi:TBC1 domain family member 15